MAKQSYTEIKEIVGNAWALVANPEYEDDSGHFTHAELLYFHKDKKQVRSKIKDFKLNYKHLGFFYLGLIPENVIYTVNL